MSYKEELEAKLAAVRTPISAPKTTKVDISSAEQTIALEITQELELTQYDLDESDILRTIKIKTLLDTYGTLFYRTEVLVMFYAISKADILHANTLFSLVDIPKKHFLHHLKLLKEHELITIDNQEILLSINGKNLAQQIGVDIFF